MKREKDMTTNNSNVVYIDAKIGVQADALIADAVLANLIECAKDQQRMLKAQELALTILKDQIREIIGKKETVLSHEGSILATYHWVKGSEGVDRKALQLHFADVYEVCKTVGESKRRLELK